MHPRGHHIWELERRPRPGLLAARPSMPAVLARGVPTVTDRSVLKSSTDLGIGGAQKMLQADRSGEGRSCTTTLLPWPHRRRRLPVCRSSYSERREVTAMPPNDEAPAASWASNTNRSPSRPRKRILELVLLSTSTALRDGRPVSADCPRGSGCAVQRKLSCASIHMALIDQGIVD